MSDPVGPAGAIARAFLQSKLTPLVVAVVCAFGVFAVFATPRQENPQITMPAAMIVTRYPGASAGEVQRLVTERGERVLQEVPGIEHVYAISQQNVSILTVLFHVGDDPDANRSSLCTIKCSRIWISCRRERSPQITPLWSTISRSSC